MNSLVSPLPASATSRLCLSDGRLNPEAVGWSKRPQLDCHIPRHFGRRKRWNHWCITTPNWMLAITLADLDLLGFAAAYFLDLHSGKSIAFTQRSLFSRGCELADTPQASQAFEHPQLHIRVDEQAGRTRLSVNAPDIGGQALQVELDIQRPAHLESMNLVVPFTQGGSMPAAASSACPSLAVSNWAPTSISAFPGAALPPWISAAVCGHTAVPGHALPLRRPAALPATLAVAGPRAAA